MMFDTWMSTTKTLLIAVLLTLSAAALGTENPGEAVSVRELNLIVNERDRQYGQRFDAQEKAVAAALAAAKEAVVKAEAASEKRFDSVNEFRNTLKDQTATFITRGEAIGFFFGICGIGIGLATYFRKSR